MPKGSRFNSDNLGGGLELLNRTQNAHLFTHSFNHLSKHSFAPSLFVFRWLLTVCEMCFRKSMYTIGYRYASCVVIAQSPISEQLPCINLCMHAICAQINKSTMNQFRIIECLVFHSHFEISKSESATM